MSSWGPAAQPDVYRPINKPPRRKDTLTARPGVVVSAVANWTAYGVTAVVGFFLAPYVLHSLGNSAYGLWVLLASLVSYLGLLDLGVRAAIARFVAHHHAIADHAGASRVVAASLRLFVVLGTVATLLSVVLAFFVDRLFTVPPEMLSVAQAVIILGGASVAASFVGGVFGGIIAGLHRFDVDSGLEIVLTLLRAALVILALHAGAGLMTLAWIQFGITVVRGLAGAVAFRRLYPELSLRARGPVGDTMRTLLSFGLLSSAIHLANVVLYASDSVLIGIFMPVSMIAFFAIPSALADYARNIGYAVSRVVTPRVSAAAAEHGDAAARNILLRVGQGTSLAIIPVALTFILRGETFINLWMGPDYGAVGGPILMILGLAVWLAGGRAVAMSGLMGVNRQRGLAPAIAAEAVVNIALVLVLIRPLGLIGVALGAVIPSLAVSLLFLPWYVRRSVGGRTGDFARQVWLLPSVAALPFGVLTYVVERTWPAESILVFFVQTAVLLPLIAVTGMLLVYSPARCVRALAEWRDAFLTSRRRDSARA